MIATIKPSVILGEAKAPPSKSMMQRACALALLNKGETIIYNYGKKSSWTPSKKSKYTESTN